MKLGMLADSLGNVDVLETAVDLLLARGVERVAFLGGYWGDLDALFQRRREKQRGRKEYTDNDFLGDIAQFMAKHEVEQRGAAAAAAASRDPIDKFVSRFVRVPDKDSLQYRDPQIPVKLPELFFGLIASLVHDKADLSKEDIANATILVHGRGKEAGVVQIGPRAFVTPGRLAGAAASTCAYLEGSPQGVVFVALEVGGREIRRTPLAVGAKTKITVK